MGHQVSKSELKGEPMTTTMAEQTENRIDETEAEGNTENRTGELSQECDTDVESAPESNEPTENEGDVPGGAEGGAAADRRAAEQDLLRRIVELMPDIREAEAEWEEQKDRTKTAKELVDYLHKKLVEYGKQLEQVQAGQWQRTLPYPDEEDQAEREEPTEAATAAEDAGSEHPISALGMTAKETEALEAADLETVGKLESAIRADAWWFKRVDKFGPAKVDKLMDKLLDFRREFPVPGE